MLNTIYETGYDLHVAKTCLPVALMAAGVVVTDGTTATTCTMAADEA